MARFSEVLVKKFASFGLMRRVQKWEFERCARFLESRTCLQEQRGCNREVHPSSFPFPFAAPEYTKPTGFGWCTKNSRWKGLSLWEKLFYCFFYNFFRKTPHQPKPTKTTQNLIKNTPTKPTEAAWHLCFFPKYSCNCPKEIKLQWFI